MRAIGYLRVSTDEQVGSGAGLDGQRDAIEKVCQREGWELAEVFQDEGVSGAVPLHKRAGLMDAVTEVGRGEVLVVAKRDRLSRDVMISAGVERLLGKRKARVVSAAGEGTESDDPAAVLMRRMVDSFAEYERLLISARTRAALRAKKKRGQRVGAVPFGFRVVAGVRSKSGRDARLESVPEQAAVLVKVKRWREGGLSMRAIAGRLTDEKVPTAKGGSRWSHATVQRLLQREDL